MNNSEFLYTLEKKLNFNDPGSDAEWELKLTGNELFYLYKLINEERIKYIK